MGLIYRALLCDANNLDSDLSTQLPIFRLVEFLMDSDSEWRERGVEFKLVDESMIPSVIELLDESFFPDEPLFRCLISLSLCPRKAYL